MSTLYLHMGMPKTGTTYIQNFMRKNKATLGKNGYIYPKFDITFEGIGVNRNAHFMVCEIRDENGELNIKEEQQVFDDCFNTIGELFKTYDNVVLSEEALWNSAEKLHFNTHLWTDLKKKSEEMNFDIKIIAYLRRQDLFVQSYWAQQVKETYTRSFEKFLEGAMYKKLKLDYYARLSEIAEYIGKENMLVRVYEKSQYQGTDNTLISDFLHTIGLELTDEFVKPEKERMNRSLSGVYLETKRKMNAFDEFKVKLSWFSQLLQKVAEKNDDQAVFDANLCFSDPQQLKNYIDSFAESNSKVAREFLGRQDGKLFLEMPDTSEIKESVKYTDKDIYKILGDVITLQRKELVESSDKYKELQAEMANLKAEHKAEVKKLKSTIAWVSAPLHKKIHRKIKRVFKK